MGGAAMALILKKKAHDLYYASPKYCKQCSCLMNPKENEPFSQLRKRTFCSKKCHSLSMKKEKKPRVRKQKLTKSISDRVENLTKEEIFLSRKNWQSARTDIRKHAHFIFSQSPDEKCVKCGYNLHIEICHMKSVASFQKQALIKEINERKNLIGLCPNCHWEFDSGLFSIENLEKNAS